MQSTDQSSAPEVSTPDVAPPVPESVPETPAAEPTAQPAPEPPPAPEPSIPEPFWSKRRYIRRAFSFPYGGAEVQGNFFDLGGGRFDVDGLYGSVEFESMDHLVRLAAPSAAQAKELIAKVEAVLARR